MKTRVMALILGITVLGCSVTAWGAPSPSVSTDEEITSDVLVTSDKSVEEIIEAAKVLIANLTATGELDADGKLTATGVSMMTNLIANHGYSVNGETLDTGLVVQLTTDNREVAGLILSLDGELLGTIELGAITVTNSSEGVVAINDGQVTKPVIPGLDEAQEVQMQQALTQLFGTEETVTVEEADTYLRNVLASIGNITVAEGTSLEVRNIIDVNVSEYSAEALKEYSGLALITVAIGVADNEYVAAIHNNADDSWENLPCINNGDGTVSFAMNTFSPVAFVVSEEPIIAEVSEDVEVEDEIMEDEVEETTGINTTMIQYIVIAAIVIGVIAFVIVKKKKGE